MKHGSMLQRLTVLALSSVMIAGGLLFNAGTASAQAGPKPVVETQQAILITAVVTAIDLSTRHVTLQGPNGSVTVHVSEQVNLAQLKVGDKVGATYYESLVIAGQKASPGDNSVKAMSTTQIEDERGQSGGSAGVQRTVVVVAKVVALDKTKGAITLRGPQGNVRTFKVKDPSVLLHMTIGDNVVFKYTEAWAVALAKV